MKVSGRSHKSASLEVRISLALPKAMRDQTREITRLHASEQGQGHATELMHQVCQEADEAGITLVLWPRPYGDDMALGQSQLIDWYARRFGFVQIQPDPPLMARMPGSTPMLLTPVAAGAFIHAH